MMTKPCFSAVLFFVLFSVSIAFAKDISADEDKKPVVGLGMEFKFFGADVFVNDYLKEVNNIPIELRQVPSHPNDTWIYGSAQVIRTIPYDSVEPDVTGGLLFSLSPELTIWRWRVRSGPNFYLKGLNMVILGSLNSTFLLMDFFGRNNLKRPDRGVLL